MAETFTDDLELSKFAQRERFPVVSAAKLNANWTALDLAAVGKGSVFPATFGVGKLFVKTGGVGRGQIFQNTGTLSVPVWTSVIDLTNLGISDVSGLQAALDAKASIAYVDAGILAESVARDAAISAALASVPSAADVAIGKPFFLAQGSLPANTILEELYTYPNPDFTNLNGGAMSRYESIADFTVGNPGNFGWDMGAQKSEALIVVGGQRTRQTFMGVFMSSALPVAGNLPDGSYIFEYGQGGAAAEVFKRAGGLNVSLGINGNWRQSFGNDQSVPGVAFHYKDSTDLLRVYIRYGHEEWGRVFNITDASFTTMRYVGVIAGNGGGGVGDHFLSYVPVGIYAA